MSKQRRRRLNRNKRTRSRRGFIRNGVEQLESRVLPGGFLDLLAGAAIAATFDLLPNEQLATEEIEAESRAVTLRARPANPLLQTGLSLPDIELEPNEERVALRQNFEGLDIAPVSRATTNLLVSASFVDAFFTSNQFVDTTARPRVSPSPPLSNPSASFSSPISQLGSGIGSGSGQGYNVTGAELPQASAVSTPIAASSLPAWMMGEGEGGASSSGSAPPPPPLDPCQGAPAPSVTIDAVPTSVSEMDVITISGTVENGYPDRPVMGDKWVTTEWHSDYAGQPSTWSISGFYIDDGNMAIAMTGGYYCGSASAVATIAVANVAPSIDSAPGSSINEGDEAVLTVKYSDATNGYGYSSENWTLTVDWGDGETSSYTDDRSSTVGDGGSGTGLGAAPGSNIPPMEHTFRHVYEDDAYGDSPTPNETANYPVRVTITDGTDTVFNDSIITVNNVAPTVTITSITPIDSVSQEQGGVDGRLDESEGFIVRGTVTDPGVLDTHTATLEVDLNFDGDVDDAGETVVVPLTLVSPGSYTFEMTIARVLDDGRWTDNAGNPVWGNETEEDPIVVTVTVEDDDTGKGDATKTIMINNVPPRFVDDLNVENDEPRLEFEFDEDGVPIAVTVLGSFVDPGSNDFHKLSIAWGDGVTGDGIINPIDLPLGTRTYAVTRILPVSPPVDVSDLFPVELIIRDDDLGTDSYTIEQPSCSCECEPVVLSSQTAATDNQALLQNQATQGQTATFVYERTAVIPNTPSAIGPQRSDKLRGTSWKFTFRPGAEAAMVQQVQSTGTLSMVDDCGDAYRVSWTESYVEAWTGPGEFTDNHKMKPQAPAEYLESKGGFGLTDVLVPDGFGGTQRRLRATFASGRVVYITSWDCEMTTQFQMVNGRYPNWAGANFNSFYNSQNSFAITDLVIRSR